MGLWGMIVNSMQSKLFDGGINEGLNLTLNLFKEIMEIFMF